MGHTPNGMQTRALPTSAHRRRGTRVPACWTEPGCTPPHSESRQAVSVRGPAESVNCQQAQSQKEPKTLTQVDRAGAGHPDLQHPSLQQEGCTGDHVFKKRQQAPSLQPQAQVMRAGQQGRVQGPAPRQAASTSSLSAVAQVCLTLCDPMDRSTPGFPVHHQLPEFTQTHVNRVSDAISHLILCRPLLLPPSIFPSITVFSNESVLRMRWPKYWSFSFSISPSNEHPGLISFRMD